MKNISKNNLTHTDPNSLNPAPTNLAPTLGCLYYTGAVERSKVWVLVSALRATEHVCFDRTLNVKNSIFEFFVPESMNSIFLEVTKYLQDQNVLLSLEQHPNRLALEK